MSERIQKIISARGVASRRTAEKWIQEGIVTVNGKIVRLGDTADADTDEICINGKPLPAEPKNVYVVLNKPRGYVTTLSDEKGRRDVTMLVSDCNQRIYPVGRLDMDSEGLLLLTNDGEFANCLMHPRHTVEKEYEVWVEGYKTGDEIKLRTPIVLDGYRIAPPEVRCMRTDGTKAVLNIMIHEGRNRQIRRMCSAVGLNVTRLKRVREGSLELGDVPVGKWRFLTPEEVEKIRK